MAQAKSSPPPPESLGKAGKKFWKAVLGEYELSDQHHLRLLENAAMLLDRAAAAREIISVAGITTLNQRGEVKEHPSVGTERQSISLFRQCVRELGLDVEDAPAAVRGPRRPGTRNC